MPSGHNNLFDPIELKIHGRNVTEPEDVSKVLADQFESANSSKNYDPHFLIQKEQQELNDISFLK